MLLLAYAVFRIMLKSKLISLFFCAWVCSFVSLAQPANDICSSATNIQDFFGQGEVLTLPFSNVGATGNDLDIATVTGCWLDDLTGNADGSSPQIDATVWFYFEGFDGTLSVFTAPCDSTLNFLSADTQMALYSGECDTLELVACNEDINADQFNYWSGIVTPISANTSYYLVVDGFNYSGFGSPDLSLTTGELCLSMVPPVVSVENARPNAISLFPNPTSESVTLSTADRMEEIVVFDLSGKECSRLNAQNLQTVTLEMPNAAGVYTVVVRTNATTAVHRVIKE